MKKLLVIFLCSFLLSQLSAAYGYFSSPNIIQIPNKQIRFVAAETKEINLQIYELNLDLVKLIKHQANQMVPYEFILKNLGKRILNKSFKVQQDWQEFEVFIDKPGIYAGYLIDSSKNPPTTLDFEIFIVTEISAVMYVDDRKSIVQVSDSFGNPVSQAEVNFFKNNTFLDSQKTDAKGVAVLNKTSDLAIIKSKKSYAICEVYRWREADSQDKKVFLVTDRPIYKPSDTIYFRGQLLERQANLYKVAGSSSIRLSIKDPKGNEIYEKQIQTDELGSFWDSFKLSETAAVGSYWIEVLWDGQSFYERFLVEEYRKPEYKIEIETEKEEYVSDEKINITIRVKYFNEDPVVGANVAVYVYAQPEEFDRYLVFRGYEYTNENGELKLSILIDEGFEGYYIIQAIASDESQRQVEEEKEVYVHADRILIDFDERYIWTAPGEKLSIKVRVTDLEGNPIDGLAEVRIGDETFSVQIDKGEGKFVFTPKEITTYKIEFRFQKAKSYVYVYSYGFMRGYRVGDFQIVTDKKEYTPGENMTVQIFTPKNTTGILVLATDEIHSFKPFSTKDMIQMELKIPDDLSQRQLFLICTAFVENKEIQRTITLKLLQNFNVETARIELDKEIYQPGEECVLTIHTQKDYSLCLTVVDEAIYTMLGQKPKLLEESIYPVNEYPEVDWSFSSEWFYFRIDYSFRKSNLAEVLSRETTFENYKREAVEVRMNVREYFPDTALWIPNLQTTNGVAKVLFKVPDSLTTFVVTAYGFSSETFAQGQNKFAVTKDFYVIPHLPSFFREGDIVQIAATVNNRIDQILETTVWIEPTKEFTIIEQYDPHTEEFFIPEKPATSIVQPNSSATYRWTVQAVRPSTEAGFTTFAQSPIKEDAVMLKTPVKPFAFEREFYFLEALSGRKEISLPQAEYVSATLRTYSSVVPLLEGSIRKLIRFPYGCTEQTMSSFLPAVVAAQMGLKIEELDEIVQKGLMRLYKYQHYDGGWGWWQTDETNDFMTCYVMEGLYYAIKAGYHVAESVVKAAIEYLLENPTPYGSYVLTLFGVEHKKVEPSKSLDWVYLAMSDEKAVDQMMKLVVEDERFAYVKVDENDYFTTEVQMTSLALRVLAKWNKYPEIQTKMINYLFNKKDGYMWYSTKDTSYACLALIEALPNFGEPSLKVVNNERILTIEGSTTIVVDPGFLMIEGFGLVEVHVIYKQVPSQSVDEGLSVERRYYKRYEVPVLNKRAYVDAFVPLNQKYVPVSAKIVEDYKTSELYIEPYFNGELEYYGTKLNVKAATIYIDGFPFAFRSAQTFKGKILILSEAGAIVYDCLTKISAIYHGAKDAALVENGILLWKNDGLWLNDKYLGQLPFDAQKLLSDGKWIFVVGENTTYWYQEGKFVELPFVASRIFDWDGKKVIATNFRFAGNDSILSSAICEIVFEEETFPIKLSAGDVVKTELRILKGQGNYLVVEDYIPSCAQVLPNYSEKVLGEFSKFDYRWYREWRYWFASREIHMDRVVFFATQYSSMKMSYYWRATANGLYKILPARAYSMYYKGLYGHSDPDELDIGVWFEVCKVGKNP
ncbi:MG2 domain-containing protein [Pseudothermotoga thermarum]|uniref:Alpha-2-macroglobulin domain protein n=1 Tax=Pseudothermotoga thermarum DSM 5069 TaxID=688269 RepID=F7YWB5_9THEM|nr:MG2 domain-containing protein [Pseudothermotoga thermarum]AEH51890.1 alpha-2-macroglobulin domain protein [Pseudothermotoga thermarum DSM 5069]